MDAEKFAHYIKNPAHLYQITYTELKSLVLQFPYCQNLRYLLLKKSILENHNEKDQNLQLAATYSLDRKLLYNQIKMGESFVSESDNFIIKEDYLELKELNDIPEEHDQPEPVTADDEQLDSDNLVFETGDEPSESNDLIEEMETFETSTSELNESSFYDELMAEDDELEDITLEMDGIFLDSSTPQEPEELNIDPEPGEAIQQQSIKSEDLTATDDDKDDSISIEELIKLDNLTPLERLEKSVAEKRSKKKKSKAAKAKLEEKQDSEKDFKVSDLDNLSNEGNASIPLEIQNKKDLNIKEEKASSKKSKSKATFGNWLKQFQDPEEKNKKSKKIGKKKKVKKKAKATKPESAKKGKPKSASNKTKAPNVNPKRVAEKSLKENEEIVSEPLAILLVKQGSYKKAIRMYEKLSLIFPEKSSFFAEQIENLKKL